MMRKRMLVAAMAAAALAGCGTTAPEPPVVVPATSPAWSAPEPTPTADAPSPLTVQVVAGSPHVTGSYPTHCTAGTDPAGHAIPDPACTPGSVRDDVTADTLAATICKPGWTGTVRPPVAETDGLKTTAMRAYGSTTTRGTTELDHLVPLALGGSNDASNLWPQPSDQPRGFGNSKDQVEVELNRAVCTGKITLADAQRAIASDWGTAEETLGLR